MSIYLNSGFHVNLDKNWWCLVRKNMYAQIMFWTTSLWNLMLFLFLILSWMKTFQASLLRDIELGSVNSLISSKIMYTENCYLFFFKHVYAENSLYLNEIKCKNFELISLVWKWSAQNALVVSVILLIIVINSQALEQHRNGVRSNLRQPDKTQNLKCQIPYLHNV